MPCQTSLPHLQGPIQTLLITHPASTATKGTAEEVAPGRVPWHGDRTGSTGLPLSGMTPEDHRAQDWSGQNLLLLLPLPLLLPLLLPTPQTGCATCSHHPAQSQLNGMGKSPAAAAMQVAAPQACADLMD